MDLEKMLHEEELRISIRDNNMKKTKKATTPYTSEEKYATMYDLIKMIDRLITLTMKNKGVKFIPHEGRISKLDAMENFNHPYITYMTMEKEPKIEIKPRVREIKEIKDENGEMQIGEVMGQRFKAAIQFNIIAKDYEDAEELLIDFEDLMFKYTGFFKKNGVAEIIYGKQFRDKEMARIRETLSVRNLFYYVEIEKTTVIFKEKIEEISILLNEEIKEE